MIEITIGEGEFFDERTEEFVSVPGKTFRFEHSLKSVSKWEQKHNIPFLSNNRKTHEQLLDYYMFMCLDKGLERRHINQTVSDQLLEYIKSTPSATNIKRQQGPPSSRIVTSEVLYALMFMSGVDKECENWHIHRLMTVLEVIGDYNSPKKKMTKNDIRKQNASLNEQRKKQLKTKG